MSLVCSSMVDFQTINWLDHNISIYIDIISVPHSQLNSDHVVMEIAPCETPSVSKHTASNHNFHDFIFHWFFDLIQISSFHSLQPPLLTGLPAHLFLTSFLNTKIHHSWSCHLIITALHMHKKLIIKKGRKRKRPLRYSTLGREIIWNF